ncbi:MAG: capsule assembly Wzi family protein, partial [Bacteroidota bacterium]
KIDLKVLSPNVQLQFDSHHPYPSNNGGIVPAKGLSSLTTFGVSIRSSFLSLQLRPEIHASQNKEYDGFAESHFDVIWARRYVFWNRIDTPEQHGTGPRYDLRWGQSHALILFAKHFGIGISTENLWWGPGRRNSLLMSNNASGFPHLTFRTISPVETTIGAFETQIVAGRLDASGYNPPSTDRSQRRNSPFFVPKRDDWRYFNGIVFSYQPIWIKGLSLGFARSIQLYSEYAKETNTYFPIAINLFRKNDRNRDEEQIDQVLSVFSRWAWEDAKAEIYFEYGRNDASWHLRDFLLSPDHSRAYIFGFTKLFPIKSKFIEVGYEHTEMAQTINYLIRDAISWYMHGGVRHGYTNRGEVLGASIGPGSNMDHISVSYIDGVRKAGLVFERISNQNDFYYRAWDDINDFRRYWIDYTIGVTGSWDIGNFWISGNVLYTRSMNYQWETDEPNTGLFVPGNDVSNLHVRCNLTYMF